tara:strand:- start:51720 stop:53648 length:1929 start_codon:yes stop_codon:yes gene_type:complete
MTNKILLSNIFLLLLSLNAYGQQLREAVFISQGTAVAEKTKPTTPFPGAALDVSSDTLYQPTSEVFMQFAINFLSPNIKINSSTLQLSIKDTVNGTQGSRIFAINSSSDWTAETLTWNKRPKTVDTTLVTRFITSSDSIVQFALGDSVVINSMTRNANGKKTIGLKASSDSWDSKVVFHSQTTAEKSGDYHLSPRLVFQYSIFPEPKVNSGWRQLQYNPQRTGKSEWSNNIAPQKFRADTLYNPVGSIPGYPIVDNRYVYTFSESASHKIALVKLNLKKKIIWSYPLDNQVMESLLLDSKGNVIVVQQSPTSNTGNYIIIIDPNGVLVKKIQLKTRLAAVPTLGYDDTLYLTNQDEVFALGNAPLYETLWKHEHNCSVSSAVTISPDEKNIYIMRDALLINLSKVTGNLLSSTNIKLPYANLKEPIAISNDTVFTLGGQNNKTVISAIHNGNIIWQKTGGKMSNASVNIQDNSLYVIIDQVLFQIELGTGKVLSKSQENNLNTNSSLLINDSGQLYFMAGDVANKNFIYVYDSSCKLINSTDVTSYQINTNLIMGGDGTLYVSNENILYQFIPLNNAVPALNIDQSYINGIGNKTLRGSKVTVEGVKIPNNGNYIIQSGSSIGLQKGFSIAKGGAMIFSTGY